MATGIEPIELISGKERRRSSSTEMLLPSSFSPFSAPYTGALASYAILGIIHDGSKNVVDHAHRNNLRNRLEMRDGLNEDDRRIATQRHSSGVDFAKSFFGRYVAIIR